MIVIKKRKKKRERKKASRPAFNKQAGDTCSGDLLDEFKNLHDRAYKVNTVQHTSENESVRETTAFHRENKSSSLDRDDLNMNLMRLSTGVKVFPPCFLFTSVKS